MKSEDAKFQAAVPIPELMEKLSSQQLDDRLTAIQVLGEIGDEEALDALRARMVSPLEEYYALSVAVGKLKERLGAR
jgi:HEAT repeat protein